MISFHFWHNLIPIQILYLHLSFTYFKTIGFFFFTRKHSLYSIFYIQVLKGSVRFEKQQNNFFKILSYLCNSWETLSMCHSRMIAMLRRPSCGCKIQSTWFSQGQELCQASRYQLEHNSNQNNECIDRFEDLLHCSR